MRQIALQDAKAKFGKLVESTRNEPLVITRHGVDEAVLVPIEDVAGAKLVQGKLGATELLQALRAAPSAFCLKPLRGRFRPAKL
jgi:prevent-host-death family protein